MKEMELFNPKFYVSPGGILQEKQNYYWFKVVMKKKWIVLTRPVTAENQLSLLPYL